MTLELLHETPNVSISYDCTNQWLFLDWRGDLTLSLVQASCLSVAQHFSGKRYTRILNSNAGVTSIAANVPAWLAKEFLPYLQLVGIQSVAWVYSPNLRVKCYTDAALYTLEGTVVSLFDDLESAFAWLRGSQNFPAEGAVYPSAPTKQDGIEHRAGALGAKAHRRAAGLGTARVALQMMRL